MKDNNRRNEMIGISVSEQEREVIYAAAKEDGISGAAWIRRLIFTHLNGGLLPEGYKL